VYVESVWAGPWAGHRFWARSAFLWPCLFPPKCPFTHRLRPALPHSPTCLGLRDVFVDFSGPPAQATQHACPRYACQANVSSAESLPTVHYRIPRHATLCQACVLLSHAHCHVSTGAHVPLSTARRRVTVQVRSQHSHCRLAFIQAIVGHTIGLLLFARSIDPARIRSSRILRHACPIPIPRCCFNMHSVPMIFPDSHTTISQELKPFMRSLSPDNTSFVA
jgi:hypothetical protein